MYDHTLRSLTDFGLSEKEAKIYLALLELGEATAFQVSARSGVNRSSTYVVLESLSKRGLSGLSGDKKVRRYIAVAPEAIAQMASENLKRSSQIKEGIESILPRLGAIQKNIGTGPRIRVFNGNQGLINSMTEFLSTGEKVLRAFTSGENVLRLPREMIQQWAEARVSLGVELRSLCPDTKEARELMSVHPFLYTSIYLPVTNYPSPVDMMIASDRVAYLVVDRGDTTVIFIDSVHVGTVMKGVFDMAFEEARRIGDVITAKRK